MKELKIQIPEGYEIDRENSTFECIKFKPIENITYEQIARNVNNTKNGYYYIDSFGRVCFAKEDFGCQKGNSSYSRKQLERILALNQLLNIAEYYNKNSKMTKGLRYKITYVEYEEHYDIHCHDVGDDIKYGVEALFNREEDAQAVIDNPNFRKILDTIYK